MTFSLEQLLEATGVDELAGTPFTKRASEESIDFLKLAAECREAASVEEVTPSQEELISSQDLVEKTAAVEIIRRTMAEIREIEGSPPETIKTASAGPDKATFIKAALEQGHSPEQIARFLEETRSAGAPKKKTATSIIG
jgi:hypothetical protein